MLNPQDGFMCRFAYDLYELFLQDVCTVQNGFDKGLNTADSLIRFLCYSPVHKNSMIIVFENSQKVYRKRKQKFSEIFLLKNVMLVDQDIGKRELTFSQGCFSRRQFHR